MMLVMESPTCYMHTFKVAILDPSTDPEGWDFKRWREDIEKRLHLIPQFRWKYASAPFGINHAAGSWERRIGRSFFNVLEAPVGDTHQPPLKDAKINVHRQDHAVVNDDVEGCLFFHAMESFLQRSGSPRP